MSSDRRFETTSGIPLKACYGAGDLEGFDPDRDLGLPGEFPFARGIQPEMYRSRFWTMRQYAGFGTAAESNARFKYLLALGQTGLSVAFDLPTQMGLDSDAAMAAGEVGRAGVAVDTLHDMERLLDNIPLEQVSISMTINSTAAILLAMTIAVVKKQGASLEKLSGTVQNDILKEYIARGTYLYPPSASLRLTTDILSYCSRFLPRWNPISISGYHIREAGSTAVQEVAFTLANAATYVEAALRAGLELDSFAPRLSFFFNVHNHFLEEVAKFRAARRLWAKTMRFRFGARSPKSWLLRFHAQTAGSTLTAQQPEVNAVRVALQALAAVLGGAQSLHTNARDEALSLPTEEAARLALRTQQVIAWESGAAETADPLGGAYAVEFLTNAIEEKCQEYLDRIEAMGGMLSAIASGYIQREIQQAAYEYQKAIESGERVIVGVNRFQSERQDPIPIHRLDPGIETSQVAALRKVKLERDGPAVEQALSALEKDASGPENLLPPILRAVEAYATVGEISDRLRKVFGEHTES
ncbi:MAG: methylmalonyl-CoA mutase family protein [Acidobacteria bacterium]|nr:methylmalonyl-CoA mutase family protein [Acidobacteriota bacterium]